jgi:hypothetical protein
MRSLTRWGEIVPFFSMCVTLSVSSERKTYSNIIYNNVLTAMKTLCLHSARYGEVSSSLAEGKALIESDLKEDQPVDEMLGAHIKALWADPAIQETYNHQVQTEAGAAQTLGRQAARALLAAHFLLVLRLVPTMNRRSSSSTTRRSTDVGRSRLLAMAASNRSRARGGFERET